MYMIYNRRNKKHKTLNTKMGIEDKRLKFLFFLSCTEEVMRIFLVHGKFLILCFVEFVICISVCVYEYIFYLFFGCSIDFANSKIEIFHFLILCCKKNIEEIAKGTYSRSYLNRYLILSRKLNIYYISFPLMD